MVRVRGQMPGPRRQEGPNIYGKHAVLPLLALEL
jgi:hypothetical protein